MATRLAQAEHGNSVQGQNSAAAGNEQPAGAGGIIGTVLISAPLGALVAFTVYMLL